MHKKSLILGLFLLFCSFAFASVFDSNVIAYYTFDDVNGTDVADSTVNALHGVGTFAGGTGLGFVGKVGKAYYSNNANNHIDLPDSNLFRLNKQFTIAYWEKTTNNSTGAYPFSSGYYNVAGTGYGIVTKVAENCFGEASLTESIIAIDGSPTAALDLNHTCTTKNIVDNQWHLFVATYDGNCMVTYIDNNLDTHAYSGNANYPSTCFLPPNYPAGASNVKIGNWNFNSTNNYGSVGYIDEMAIFDKNFSPSDVNYLWNNGLGRTYSTTTLSLSPLLPNGEVPFGIQYDGNFVSNNVTYLTAYDSANIDLFASQGYNILSMDVPAKWVWKKYSGVAANDFNWDGIDAVCNYAYSKGMYCALQMIIDGTGYWHTGSYTFLDTNFTLTKSNFQNNYPYTTPAYTANANEISKWDADINTVYTYALRAMATHFASNPAVQMYTPPPNEGFSNRLAPESTADANTYWQGTCLPSYYADVAAANTAYGKSYAAFSNVAVPMDRTNYNATQQYDWWRCKSDRAIVLYTENARALKDANVNKIVTSIKLLPDYLYPNGSGSIGYTRAIDLNHYIASTAPYIDALDVDLYPSAVGDSIKKQSLTLDMRLGFAKGLADLYDKWIYLGEFFPTVDAGNTPVHDANFNAAMIGQALAYVGSDINHGVRGLSVFTWSAYGDGRDIKNSKNETLYRDLNQVIKNTLKNATNTVNSGLTICDNTNINVAFNLDYWRYEVFWGFLNIYRKNDANILKFRFNGDCKNADTNIMYANQITEWAATTLDINTWIASGHTLITGYRGFDSNQISRADYGNTGARPAIVNTMYGITSPNPTFQNNSQFDVNVVGTKTILTGLNINDKIFSLGSAIGDYEGTASYTGTATAEARYGTATSPLLAKNIIGSGTSIHFGFNLYEDYLGSNTQSTNLTTAIRNIFAFGGKTLNAVDYNSYYAWKNPHYAALNAYGNTNGTFTYDVSSTIKTIDKNTITTTSGTSTTLSLINAQNIIAVDSNYISPSTSSPVIPAVLFTTSDANAGWNTRNTVTFSCDANGGSACRDLNYSVNSGIWVVDVNYLVLFDDFEDGDLTNNPSWNLINNTFQNDGIRISNESTLNGNYLMYLYFNVNGSHPLAYTSTLNTKDDMNYSIWEQSIDGTGDTSIEYVLFLDDTNDYAKSIGIYSYGSGFVKEACGTISAMGGVNDYVSKYQLIMNFDRDTNYVYYWIKNSSNEVISYAYNTDVNCGNTPSAIRVYVSNVSGQNVRLALVDDIVYGWSFDTNLTLSDGNNLIQFKSTDIDGNAETLKTAYHAVDTTKPTISSDVNANWNLGGDANIHLACSDASSGVQVTKFRVDDNNSSDLNWLGWETYDTNLLLGNRLGKFDGNFGLQFYCTDNVGYDSNTGTPDINFVLLEVNSPPVPVTLSPTDGNFSGIINISCNSGGWIRDINYFIDYNTNLLDWNNIANNSTGNIALDVNGFAGNTKMWFRCKTSDVDKNSAYKTNSTYIILNPDTNFDSISLATPLSPTVATAASLPFSVTASDVSGVNRCIFEIYKNSVHVLDVNGLAPNSDLNNGIWTYSYTNVVNGDIVFAYVSCQDITGSNSNRISSSTYSVSIIAGVSPPSGGGGGGSTTISFVTPSLVTLQPSTLTLNLPSGTVKKIYSVLIHNLTSGKLTFGTALRDGLDKYFNKTYVETPLNPGEYRLLTWEASVASDTNFEAFTGYVEFNLNNGQEYVKQDLTLTNNTDWFASLLKFFTSNATVFSVNGINFTSGMLLIIVLIVGGIIFTLRRK